ncbi:hypothetical protein M422DRAFT_239886 [Sphaerobolus stellatus SS14]|nr:hypothetical protein M422DRAFT_239886 [Sphaerobolus stellatus SS14]
MENLSSYPFYDEFKPAQTLPWFIPEPDSYMEAGAVRYAGPGAGNFTFVSVYNAECIILTSFELELGTD